MNEPLAISALQLLVDEGCNRNVLLQLSFAYGVFQYANERNRQAELATRPEDRLLLFTGGIWTRRDAQRIARNALTLADELDGFLRHARVPGQGVSDDLKTYFLDMSRAEQYHPPQA